MTETKLTYITGYTDRISVKPGENIEFKLSAEGVDSADACLVRIIHGDEDPQGPGFVEEPLSAVFSERVQLSTQFTQAGNHIEMPNFNLQELLSDTVTLHMLVYPTLLSKTHQVLLSQYDEDTQQGIELSLQSGVVNFRYGPQNLSLDQPLVERVWQQLAVTIDPKAQTLRLQSKAVINSTNSLLSPIVVDQTLVSKTTEISSHPQACSSAFYLGAKRVSSGQPMVMSDHFNGKIDRSGIVADSYDAETVQALHTNSDLAAHSISYWDPCSGYTDNGIGDCLEDIGPNKRHGYGFNRPVRAMTGFNWDGRVDCFRLAPSQFGAIHFHDDAIIDCRWKTSFTWQVPDSLASGVYAIKLNNGDIEDHVVFFVRSKKPTAKVCMLMPTASYLAYANEHFVFQGPAVEAITAHPLILRDADYLLNAHPEWGLSSYDHHSDGAGVCYTSYHRPIMGLRPKARMAATGVAWQFAADLSIVYWLEAKGIDYDILTDEDLHRDGLAAIADYQLVINGTHSEYYSTKMLDATEQYLDAGGNVLYTGANGYYWAVDFRDDEPWCMEIRKLDTGTRAWQAEPGEFYMATNGEKGGIWRARGRLPQKMLGVGFTSEGMDECKPYRRMPDSYAPEMAWLFDGVNDDVIGDFGLALGGAAGLELDRYDLALGTSPNAWLLASSEGHSDNYPHVSEEIGFNFPGLGGSQDPQVRADLCYFKTVNGGSVLATGSIAWGQALPCNQTDNNISQITLNYLLSCVAN